MPMMAIGILIVMSVMMFNIYKHKENVQESFVVGELQSQIVKNYLESEKEFFYYEKLLGYNEYKAVKEFAEKGAIKESCSKRWNFKIDCDPDFKGYFKEILDKNIENKEINLDSEIEVYFTDFDLSSTTNKAEVDYKGPIKTKKKPLINFNELEQLRDCIKDRNIEECKPYDINENIYTFKRSIAKILNEDLEKEEIILEFSIDINNYRKKIFN